MKYNFIKGVLLTSILVGTMIGVGIFAVPYAVMESGPVWGFFLLFFLGTASLLVHVFYGDVAISCDEKKRFVGYADKYLGKKAKGIATFSLVFGFLGTILAYLIVGGEFLDILSAGVSQVNIAWGSFVYSLIFWAAGAWFIFKGIKTVSSLELGMSIFLISIIFLLFGVSINQIKLVNFGDINFDYSFIAYGVFLTAFSGFAAIPEMRELAVGTKWEQRLGFRKLIVVGGVLPLLVYIIFAFSVVGVSGADTSPEAVRGLVPIFESRVVMLAALFGVVACFTSFLVLGVNLKKVLWQDWGLSKNVAWGLVVFLPLIGFLAGFKQFVPVLSFVGATMGGINGILIVLMHNKISSCQRMLKALLVLLFVFGLLFRVFKIF